VAKNFTQEGSIYEDFEKANKTQLPGERAARAGAVAGVPFAEYGRRGMTAILVYCMGGLERCRGCGDDRRVVLFLLSLDRFLFPVMSLSSYWTQVQSGLSAAERVFALVDADPNVVQIDSKPVPPLKGEADYFDHVEFHYKPANLCCAIST
jgi:ATP-binding cassette, subfamily B, bacterial